MILKAILPERRTRNSNEFHEKCDCGFFLCFSHTRPAKINRFFLFLQLITEKLTVLLIRRRKLTRWLYRVSIIIIIVKIPQFMNFFYDYLHDHWVEIRRKRKKRVETLLQSTPNKAQATLLDNVCWMPTVIESHNFI